mgnify:CR=1 FL=1
MEMPKKFIEMFEKDVFANLATIMKDGSPHVVPVWVGIEDKYIITAGGIEHVRHANMKREPRVALTISTSENPYEVYLVRGEVVSMLEQGGKEFLDQEARRRWGTSEYPFQREKERYLIRILPDKIIDTSTVIPAGARIR